MKMIFWNLLTRFDLADFGASDFFELTLNFEGHTLIFNYLNGVKFKFY